MDNIKKIIGLCVSYTYSVYHLIYIYSSVFLTLLKGEY